MCDFRQRLLIGLAATLCGGEEEELEGAVLYDAEGRVMSVEEGGKDGGLKLCRRLVEMSDDLHRGKSGRTGREQRGSWVVRPTIEWIPVRMLLLLMVKRDEGGMARRLLEKEAGYDMR